MNRVFITVSLLLSSSIVLAGKCETSTEILNSQNKPVKYDICINFETSAGCEFPKKIEIPSKGKVDVSFTFMCGYSSDPPISEYWLMYREEGTRVYSFKNYNQQGLVL